jgi:Methyltransferase domain
LLFADFGTHIDNAPEDARTFHRRPWDGPELEFPPVIYEVPAMLTLDEKRMLYYLARHYYREGAIADMGAFLGGSTVCLAAGLKDRGITKPVIHSYDLFRAGPFEAEKWLDGCEPGMRTRDRYDENVKDYTGLIEVHEGDVLSFPWSDGKIELLFVDLAKSYQSFDHIVSSFFPALIPERSVVILQDYIFPKSGPWHHVVMEKLGGYFEYVGDTTLNSALFLLTKPIPKQALDDSQWQAIGADEKAVLMARAIERYQDGPQREALLGVQQLLVEGRDQNSGAAYHRLGGGDDSS